MLKKFLFSSSSLLILSACSSGGDDPVYACPAVIAYANGVTVSGTAVYEYRTDGNQAISLTPNPIRKAEVQVLNSAGSLIQCGTTDDNGLFSLQIPVSSASHSVRINSKIYNSITKLSVLNNPSSRALHFLSTTFVPSGSLNVGTLVATAASAGELKGGAFNILDKILSANLYLFTATSGCSASISTCVAFTGAPDLKVYWDKGVNPGEYFGAGPTSFYLPGFSELYLLGGENGDINNSDTDHFDNTIIIHEYGHFIEDIFADTNSPGGEHNGRKIIDPRLAWGEGWANFFKAAVLNEPTYRDTVGTIDGMASVAVFRDIETPDLDIPATMGEGNFREFSISRLLWDAIDATDEGNTDLVNTPFYELWTLFTSSTVGLKASSRRFRNVGMFHQLQTSLGFSDWSSIRTMENHRNTQVDYVRSATRGGACAATAITAANIPNSAVENGTVANTNQFASNDFYQFSHAGGAFSLQLSYTPTTEGDLDLYLYKEVYKYGDTTTYANAPSVTRQSAATDNAAGTEAISVANLAAGVYVINVRVYTGLLLGSATYSMTLNGANLCPN